MNNLAEIDAWMQAAIAPNAQAIDSDPSALFQAFKQLGDHNLLAPRLPKTLNGLGWDDRTYSQFQISIASHSGALAFLSSQHHSAVTMLGTSANEAFRINQLPTVISGAQGIGVGFSQLRQPGPPMMSATPINGGYHLSGKIPWVTGLGCFDGFICGASLPSGKILMGWVPLRSGNSDPRIRVSQPLALAAMESTQTVEVRLNHWPLDSDQVIAIHRPEWLLQKDQGNTLYHGFYALGSAKAALKLLTPYQQAHSSNTEIQRAIAALQKDYQSCESQLLGLLPHRPNYPDRCLKAKAKAIQLAGRIAQAAIAVSGGGANHRAHPAQRIYREVLAFTIFGQTSAAKVATLLTLSSSCHPSIASDHPTPIPASED